MTIQVISNSTPVAEQKPAEGSALESASKPAAAAAEQNTDALDTAGTEEVESDQDDDTESDETEKVEGKEAQDGKPRKKSGAQRRKERAERAEAEVARLQRVVEGMALKGAGESETQKTEKPIAAEGKPKPDDFETYAEYTDALTDWKIEQREAKNKAEVEKSKLKDEQAKLIQSHHERVKAFAVKNADFNEVLEAVDDVPTSSALQELIMSSEHGPALMYELAKNREECVRISALPPLACAREMGKLEAKIAASSSEEKKSEPKTITKAPKPIDPVGNGGKGAVTKSLTDPTLSQAEYEAIRRKQIASRQGGW